MRRKRQIWITLDSAGRCSRAQMAAAAGNSRADNSACDRYGRTARKGRDYQRQDE